MFILMLEMNVTIDSSGHVLEKVNISLAILRERPQCQRVWHFIQADWQGLQAAISLQDWSPIFAAPDINSTWEFFHRNVLSHSCTDSSHLIFRYPTLLPNHGTLNSVVR